MDRIQTPTTAAAPTADVAQLLGRLASWLDTPHRVDIAVEPDRLLAVLHIHARFMHGCRDLKSEAASLFAQVPFGDPAGWNTRHRAYQDAEDFAGLAWGEAMVDAGCAFLALTGIDPDTAAYVAALGMPIPAADPLRNARRLINEAI